MHYEQDSDFLRDLLFECHAFASGFRFAATVSTGKDQETTNRIRADMLRDAKKWQQYHDSLKDAIAANQ